MAVNAFTFPGQGSQFVGMGRDLAAAFAAAREVFEEVDQTLGQKLAKLMFEGPAEALVLTENTQPALLAVSVASLRAAEREGGFRLADRAAVVAGHSLGEYAALVAAGSISLADAARLLRLRGRAMQAAVPAGEGAMAALLGVEMAQAEAICAEACAPGAIVQAANDNGGGQVVISGHRAAVERAVEIAKGRVVRRAMLLPVSAPFHCALMQPAADRMREALADTTILPPQVPLVANVTAEPETDPETLRALLVRQVTGTVRWREGVERMAAMGATRFVEFGAGKVLTNLVRRIVPDAEAMHAGTPAEIEDLLKAL